MKDMCLTEDEEDLKQLNILFSHLFDEEKQYKEYDNGLKNKDWLSLFYGEVDFSTLCMYVWIQPSSYVNMMKITLY